MFRDIINDVIKRLSDAGVRNIYSAFDALSVSDKGGSYYTIVGLSGFTSGRPVYSQFAAYIPYTMRLELTVTAPENCLLSQLYSYFEEQIMMKWCGDHLDDYRREYNRIHLDHFLTSITVKPVSSISRIAICAELTVKGMYKAEKED